MTGCATTSTGPESDPYEPVNRKIFSFNKFLDDAALKPAAKLYQAVTPQPMRTALYNVFENVNDVPVAVNKFLQANIKETSITLSRILINSTLGIVGLIDVASDIGLNKQYADFGQTLGIWGIEYSSYIVIPVLGPSTVRDGLGRTADWFVSPWVLIDPVSLRYAIYAGSGIVTRERLLETEDLFEVAAFDEYIFVRNAYLQQRHYMITGESPSYSAFDGSSDFDDFDDAYTDDFGDEYSEDFD